MATQETQETAESAAVESFDPAAAPSANGYRRIGHKGADAILEGNTIESFEMAVEIGVDMVELDVLRSREGRLIVPGKYLVPAGPRPLTLTQALDAFTQAPLDQVEI